jgi:hypothetical protein
MVEQSPEKACVGGSIPSLATIYLIILKIVIFKYSKGLLPEFIKVSLFKCQVLG